MSEHSQKSTSGARDNAAAAPEILERLVHRAEQAGASDIHLQMQGSAATVAFRLDGVMTHAEELAAEVADRVFGRIKFLARLKTYQESLPQDGRIEKEALKARSDIRVATYPTVSGEKIVLRLFDARGVVDIGGLGLPADIQAELERFLRQTAGLLLVTGPAGSGKTTTIYACLKRLAEAGGRHVITVEDPAEQIVPGIMQTEVNETLGLDFARAARHLLRQDPQVLVIGEIRDPETAGIALRAAHTGHLVITTLHAGSCTGVFERLLSLCPEPPAVAAALELVLNQRLVRRLCADCRGVGCGTCLRTGYHGRLPLVEMLRISGEVRQKIVARDLAGITVPVSLRERGGALVQAGLSTEAELARALGL